MAFPTTGVANQIDRWRTWLNEGKFLGIELPVDDLICALANHSEDVPMIPNDELAAIRQRIDAERRGAAEAKQTLLESPATQKDVRKLAAQIDALRRTFLLYSMNIEPLIEEE